MNSPICIPCISLHQPWAEAMRRGLKTIETRDNIPMWRSKYRGDIAIQAAKLKWNPETNPGSSWGLRERLELDNIKPESLLYGVVLCIVELVDVKKTEEIWDSIGYQEKMYGNYGDGRLALVTKNLRVLPKPVPLTGKQGWIRFRVPREYEHLVTVKNPSLGLRA